MNIDICPKGSQGKHDYRPGVPFGSSPNTEPVSAHCRNCNKTISYVTDETPFPGLNSTDD